MRIQAPIGQHSARVRPGHGAGRALGPLGCQPARRQRLLVGGQPLCRLRVIREEEPHEEGGGARRRALDDEQPAPGGQAVGAVHVPDAVGDGAAEGAGERGGGEDQRDAHGPLRVAVPEGEVVDQAWEEAGFHGAEEEADASDLGVGVGAAEAHGCGAPGEHKEGDPALHT